MALWIRLKDAAVTNLKGWPPTVTDFPKGKWGLYCWDADKPDVTVGAEGELVAYLQSVLNRFCGEELTVDGVFGDATLAAVRRFQTAYRLFVDGLVGPKTWDMVDWVAFSSYWRQYRSSTNKYSKLPVDNHGLTRETSFVECLVRANFPELRFSRNWMVDRKARGQTFLSEHAYGNALDLMFGRNIKDGTRVAQWLGGLQTRLGLRQVIYNHRICEKGRWRRLLPKSLQHTDHIHVTCNSGRRPKVVGR
jgi:hypothetical protein